MVSSWITSKARKGDTSGIAGRGLHAAELIAAGAVIAVKGGHIVTTQALHELPDPLPNSEIQITDGLHLVALTESEYEPVMLFINHSCEPNVGFGGNTVLVACHTASCRRTINGHDWQHAALQHRYRGYFSWYLQRKIDHLRATRKQ